MVKKLTNTKQKILLLGEKLLKARGINAFSYHDIASSLGVKNAAIHYHFGSKEDLLLAIIEENQRRFEQMTRETSKEGQPDIFNSLHEFFNIYISSLENNHQICLFGSLGSDFFTIGEKGRKNIKLFAGKILLWLSSILEEGRKRGQFKFQGAARTKALMICAALAGGLQLARISGKQDFYKLVDQIESDLKSN